MTDILSFLQAAGGDDATPEESHFTSEPAIEAVALRDLLSDLLSPSTFAQGDIVEWKPGLKNRRHPLYGSPA